MYLKCISVVFHAVHHRVSRIRQTINATILTTKDWISQKFLLYSDSQSRCLWSSHAAMVDFRPIICEVKVMMIGKVVGTEKIIGRCAEIEFAKYKCFNQRKLFVQPWTFGVFSGLLLLCSSQKKHKIYHIPF